MKEGHTDESLDLVDENDNVIGQNKRSEIYAKNWSNFRVVNIFIVNSEGKLWIPRRATGKRIFPLCLDASVGGHVKSGETYVDALKRELKEELNISLDSIVYRLLGHLKPHKHGVSAFMKVYEIQMDKTPDYNKDDFVEYFWLTPEELFQRAKNGEKMKGDLLQLVRLFYSPPSGRNES